MDDIIVLLSRPLHILDTLSFSRTNKDIRLILAPLIGEYKQDYNNLLVRLNKCDIHCYLPKNIYNLCMSYENVVYCAISYEDRLIYDLIKRLCKFESVIAIRETMDYYKYMSPNDNLNYTCRSKLSNKYLQQAIKNINLSTTRLYTCTHTEYCTCHGDLCHVYIVVS